MISKYILDHSAVIPTQFPYIKISVLMKIVRNQIKLIFLIYFWGRRHGRRPINIDLLTHTDTRMQALVGLQSPTRASRNIIAYGLGVLAVESGRVRILKIMTQKVSYGRKLKI